MYLRTATRKTKTSSVSYLQLAHNEWDPVRSRSVPKVLYSFGRVEDVDRAGIERLIGALQRFVGIEPDAGGRPDGIPMPGESRPAGGALLLDGLWRRLGLDKLITKAGQGGPGRRREMAAMERVVFSLVANRALAPSSKLAAAEWANEDVHIPGLEESAGRVDEDACYRAMDWLNSVAASLAERVYGSVTDLLNLDVDILFFDTTSTYFETGQADEKVGRDECGQAVTDQDGQVVAAGAEPPGGAVKTAGLRTYGKSKDSRDDLPQVIIGMAVTRDGIPVRVWSWPGNTADSALIRQVRADMRDWSLSRVIYAADRGFTSAANRKDLMAGGDGYILGEKLRSGTKEAQAALSRPGRYQQIKDNMHVKEVDLREVTGSPERFVICYNPSQAERDAATRDQLVTRLEEMITGTDTLSPTKRAELRGRISTMPGLNRFLRVTPKGLLRVDKSKIAAEANLDGKYLLRTSDPKLSAEDIALGYKQLLQVERGWRDMKSTLDLRPVFHRLEERIRAHVTLCWLALLLIRIVENATGQTWNQSRRQLQRIHAVTYDTDAGQIQALTTINASQAAIFTHAGLPVPKQLLDLTPAA